MVKIYKGNLPQRINVVVDGKVIATAVFGEDGIYETDNVAVIKELKEYGYKVEEIPQVEEKLPEAPARTRKKAKDLD